MVKIVLTIIFAISGLCTVFLVVAGVLYEIMGPLNFENLLAKFGVQFSLFKYYIIGSISLCVAAITFELLRKLGE